MALPTKLSHQNPNFPSLILLRHLSSPSSILSPSNPSAILTAKQKSRAALHLLRSETDPSRIIQICHAAALHPSSHLDRHSFSSAISKLSSSNSFSSIRSLLHHLLLNPNPKNPNPNFISHAIVLFGQANMLEDAILAFQSLPSPRSLNSLLFACLISKNHSELAKIFREFPAIHGVTPNLETYNTVIKSFAESGTSRSFFSVFDEMLKRKIKPNATTFCNAITGFYKEQMFHEVDTVLGLMKRHGCDPGVSTYNVRILGLSNLGKTDRAKELLEEMVRKRVKPSWVSYGYLIVGFGKEGNLEEAKRAYKLMRSNGGVAESWVYFAFMNYLCKGGDFGTALEVCREAMGRNWVPCFAGMKELVNGLSGSSRVDEAKDLVEKVKERFPQATHMWKEVEEGLLK